jgi:hypothetical protein
MGRGKLSRQVLALVIASLALSKTLSQAQQTSSLTNDTSTGVISLDSDKGAIWQSGVGEGFRSKAQSFTLSAGAMYGLKAFGSVEAHDLALVSLTYGRMLGDVLAEGGVGIEAILSSAWNYLAGLSFRRPPSGWWVLHRICVTTLPPARVGFLFWISVLR